MKPYSRAALDIANGTTTLAEVLAAAWDEGYTRGARNGTSDDWDDDVNPYRDDPAVP